MISGNIPEALMSRIIHEQQNRLREAAASSARNEQTDSALNQGADEKLRMTETRIYIGLNDSQTKEQKFETEKYMSVLKSVCRNYHVAFSVDIESGGYYHDNGEYTEETSFVLIMINADRQVVQNIAKDLCSFFHQESVLVTESYIDGYFITDKQI